VAARGWQYRAATVHAVSHCRVRHHRPARLTGATGANTDSRPCRNRSAPFRAHRTHYYCSHPRAVRTFLAAKKRSRTRNPRAKQRVGDGFFYGRENPGGGACITQTARNGGRYGPFRHLVSYREFDSALHGKPATAGFLANPEGYVMCERRKGGWRELPAIPTAVGSCRRSRTKTGFAAPRP
jgi:hypothetical protein